MRRISGLLKDKAISSLRRATAAFNGVDDDGRQTTVLLHLQHCFEMLLKAALLEKGVAVFNRRKGRAIGFEKCLNLSGQQLGLAEAEVGILRAIDALRDDEQHYLAEVSEDLLYVHARGAVTLFDEILTANFSERLADNLPERVLPISTSPPRDIQILIDEQFHQVNELLKPGKRRRAEARAKIRDCWRWRATFPRKPRSASVTSTGSSAGSARAKTSPTYFRASDRSAPSSPRTGRP
jgi:hypothetical protein